MADIVYIYLSNFNTSFYTNFSSNFDANISTNSNPNFNANFKERLNINNGDTSKKIKLMLSVSCRDLRMLGVNSYEIVGLNVPYRPPELTFNTNVGIGCPHQYRDPMNVRFSCPICPRPLTTPRSTPPHHTPFYTPLYVKNSRALNI